MKLSMKIIFSLWLATHEADSVHSYGSGQSHPGMPKVISTIKISIFQD